MSPFIAFEGIDGAGKGTQVNLLISRIESCKRTVTKFGFPRYDNRSAYNITQYLNGLYGTAEEVGPQLASFFFAEDRKAAKAEILNARGFGIVVCDRYAGSNLAHQGGKIANKAERIKFFRWADRLEYEVNGIPKPDINPVLFIPPEASRALVLQKAKREHLTSNLDLHEADVHHLRKTYDVYRELVDLFPDKYIPVECFEDGRHLSPEEIHKKIWDIVAPVVGC